MCSMIGKPTLKRPLGRPIRKWEDNIRMDLEKIGVNTRNWVGGIGLVRLRIGIIGALVNAALNLRVP